MGKNSAKSQLLVCGATIKTAFLISGGADMVGRQPQNKSTIQEMNFKIGRNNGVVKIVMALFTRFYATVNRQNPARGLRCARSSPR